MDETVERAGYRELQDADPARTARGWWDANAADYLEEHGDFLGPADLCWCPEGLREEEAGLLGDVDGREVLEIGAGAAQGARWLVSRRARAIATDVSAGMLRAAEELNMRTGIEVPLVQADAAALPFASGAFDVVFTAYGALPFLSDTGAVHREVARVLRPGGRWVFAVTHPLRWAFPDDPGPAGLTASRSYFDRRPYVEEGSGGRILYAEYHRTLGDHVRELAAAGFDLQDLVEPEWPQGHERVWGGWGPHRGRLLPGTAVFVATRGD